VSALAEKAAATGLSAAVAALRAPCVALFSLVGEVNSAGVEAFFGGDGASCGLGSGSSVKGSGLTGNRGAFCANADALFGSGDAASIA